MNSLFLIMDCTRKFKTEEAEEEQSLSVDLVFRVQEEPDHEEEVRGTVSTQTDDEGIASWVPSVKMEPTSTINHKTIYLNSDFWKNKSSSSGTCYFVTHADIASPLDRKKGVTSRKDRTPRTALKMMEKHRENERTRHHNLNDSLSKICKRVPGSSPDGRETKVVMMQRIISYVAYLENTISNLCVDLGITCPINLTPLTYQLRDEMETRSDGSLQEESQASQSQEKTPASKKQGTKRRLKLSSPTIDSTSDHQVPQYNSQQSVSNRDGSQDSNVPTSSVLPFTNDNALSPWWNSNEDDNEAQYDPFLSRDIDTDQYLGFSPKLLSPGNPVKTFHDPSHVVPDTFHLLSPGREEEHKENSTATYHIERNYLTVGGTDFYFADASFESNSMVVSPDNILPTMQIPSSSSAFSPTQSSLLTSPVTPTQRKHKRKQSTPKRSPFSNIANAPRLYENYRFPLETIDDEIESEADESESERGSLESLGLTRHQKLKIAQLQSDSGQSSTSSPEETKGIGAKAGKIDLRKSSWMNGFMMFSRLNRRKFINANPGVHTSNISKMMGQAWRNMSPEEQGPFKEKARMCAKEMQKQQYLSEDFSILPTVSSTQEKPVELSSQESRD